MAAHGHRHEHYDGNVDGSWAVLYVLVYERRRDQSEKGDWVNPYLDTATSILFIIAASFF